MEKIEPLLDEILQLEAKTELERKSVDDKTLAFSKKVNQNKLREFSDTSLVNETLELSQDLDEAKVKYDSVAANFEEKKNQLTAILNKTGCTQLLYNSVDDINGSPSVVKYLFDVESGKLFITRGE
jgi:hypothetical protein